MMIPKRKEVPSLERMSIRRVKMGKAVSKEDNPLAVLDPSGIKRETTIIPISPRISDLPIKLFIA
jgi:hypothetical protein